MELVSLLESLLGGLSLGDDKRRYALNLKHPAVKHLIRLEFLLSFAQRRKKEASE
jgi:hypothetical protein